jgi:hypothetical protein
MRLTKFLAFAILGFAFSVHAANAAEQTFAKPKQGGVRVDWCYQWGVQCGKPAADRFCQSKGYTQSNDSVEDIDIGTSGIDTVVIGTGQVCHGNFCDGFTYITCEKPDLPPPPPAPPPGPGPGGADTHTYYNPKLGGARVNMCVSKGVECDGQSAADTYCSNKGWDGASDYTSTGKLPSFVKSRYIGNGKICKGPSCKAFSDITCENTP